MSNFIEDHERAVKLSALTGVWKEEKKNEDKHKAVRLVIEDQIFEVSKLDKSKPGTKVLANGVSATCKLNRTWDQELIKKYYSQYCLDMPESERPFVVEYKEVKANMCNMQRDFPDRYKIFLVGLTATYLCLCLAF